MSCGTKIYLFIHSLLLEECRYPGLTVVCENLLGGRVGGIISKPSLEGLLTGSSTHCSKLAKNPGGEMNFEILVDGAGIAILKKNIAAGTSSSASHEGWCLLLMAPRYPGETDLPGISE